MFRENARQGFEVFIHDGDKAIGAVPPVLAAWPARAGDLRPRMSGDFVVPLSAVKAVPSHKVILNRSKLDHRLWQAIGHAHDAEDSDI